MTLIDPLRCACWFFIRKKKINRRPRFYELRDRLCEMNNTDRPTLADNLEYTHCLYFTSTYLKVIRLR
jgi:hypothetical protein